MCATQATAAHSLAVPAGCPCSLGKGLALPPLCASSPLAGAQEGTGLFPGPGTAGGREGEVHVPSCADAGLVIRFVHCQVPESL